MVQRVLHVPQEPLGHANKILQQQQQGLQHNASQESHHYGLATMSALDAPSTAHIAHLQEEMAKCVRQIGARLRVREQHQRLPLQELPTVLHLEAMAVVL